jgi:hypothetical protein
MAAFHLDTALMLEVMAFAAGLTLLHFGRIGSALLLRAAAWVLIVASTATAACTVYYGIRYHVQGEFDHAHGGRHCKMRGHPGMMGMEMMGGPHGGVMVSSGHAMMAPPGEPPRSSTEPDAKAPAPPAPAAPSTRPAP